MDARIARTRAAVLRTATDLLVEGGPSAVTIDAIVARSGVAKSTIYRHWESRDDILVAVIEHCAPNLVAPDSEVGFEGGLRMLMTQFREALNDPEWARVIPALLLLKTHQEGIADLEERLGDRQDHLLERIIAIGVADGCLPADADIEQIAAQLVGPLVFAHLTGRPPVTEEFAQRIVDDFLRSHTVVET
jgi:AcrR family transcriptional regulator